MSRKLTYGQAFNEAVRQEMAADDNVFCAGEDIGAFGGVFGTYAGLQAEFGERRVVDTPISEQAIIGLGVGAAVTGLRPIVDIMFMDFICVAFDQIVNQAAKLKYMFGGAATIPLTISTGGGGGLSAAAQHSQSLEALICHIPGLKVVHPSNPYDMKGLMTSCIREDNPTIMVKHKRLLGMQGEVPEEAVRDPARTGQRPARRHRRHRRRLGTDGQRGARRRRAGGRRRHRRRGDRPAHAAAARHGHDRRVGAQDQPGDRGPRGGPLRWPRAPRSPPRSRRRRSTTSTRRSAGSPRRSRPVPFTPALEQHYLPSSTDIEAGIRAIVARPGA